MCGIESPPEIFLGDILRDERKLEKHAAVDQIGASCQLLDAVENDWTLAIEDEFITVCVEASPAYSASCAQPAESIRKPTGKEGQVVKTQRPAVVRHDHQITFIFRQAACRGTIRVNQPPMNSSCCCFAAARLAVESQDCIGPVREDCIDEVRYKENPVLVRLEVQEFPKVVDVRTTHRSWQR